MSHYLSNLRGDGDAADSLTSEDAAPAGVIDEAVATKEDAAALQSLLERATEAAGLGLKVHPHMLRHACGFALANKGHDTRALQAYLGHRNIQHTVRYTELSPDRFKDFWR
jgi:site-specific recombinase XerD